MSRRREFEIMFGSDSFLDVVANIVGILIILIVIAGVRVSQAPPKPRANVPGLGSPVDIAPTPEPQESIDAESVAPEPILAEVTLESEPDAPIEPLPELVPPPDLVTRVQDLEADISKLNLQSKKLGDSLTTSNRQLSELDLRLQTARGLLEDRKSELNATVARDAEQKHHVELARQAVARLLAQVTDLEKKSPPKEKLEHRITPVSRTVNGRELHFRLEKNRVAEVPMDALVERLKEHLQSRMEWIAKTRQHKGQVGPINGFYLEYIVGVDTLAGPGFHGHQMRMRYWEIHPERTMKGETDDVALSQGSKFYEALLSAGPDTTLTFWVYPDSYALYRKLQKFAHEHGFPVAARPLPSGLAISGSPTGTKSASQ